MSTTYPAKIDTAITLPLAVDNLTPVQASIFNNQRNAVLAIETSLGVQPEGIYGTVTGRFTTLENIVGNLQIIRLAKDLGGTLNAPLVIGIQGNPVSTVSPALGQVLTWDGIAWTPSSAGAGFVPGGDLSGTFTNQIVSKIQGNPVQLGTLGAPQDGYVLTWNNSISKFQALLVGTGSAILSGDVTGPNSGTVVSKIHGASVPASGSLTTGNGLYVTGTSVLSYSALNLAGGSDFVIGVLPAGNQAPQTMVGAVGGTTATSTINLTGNASITGILPTANQAAQTLAGDAVGTTAANTITLAGDVTGRTGVTVVINIHGASVPIAGGLTTGNVLQVNGVSSLTYAAVNLAGGVSFVTGVLPSGNQAAQTMGGAVGGTTTASTINLTGNGSITGVLPAANQASQTMGGDVTGTTASSTVVALRGKSLDVSLASLGATQDGYVLTWVNGSTDWQAKPQTGGGGSGITALTGDVTASGTGSVVATVVNIHGASIPAAGALTTGNVLQVTGASTLGYAAVNLAGGPSFVTGVLPISNQASQTMGGDVTGTTISSTVVALRGKSLDASLASLGVTQDGYVLTWINGSTDWQAKPVATISSVTMGGDVTGNSATSIVVALRNKSLASSLASIGSAQDGYVLTWVNGNSDWEAKPQTGGGGGGTTVQTGHNYGSFLNIYPFSGQTNTASTTFVTAATFEFDPTALTAANGTRTITLRVVAETTTPVMTIQLFNVTAAAAVTGSTLTTSSTIPVTLTTGDLTSNLTNGPATYQVQIEMAAGGTNADRVTLDMAVLKVTWS